MQGLFGLSTAALALPVGVLSDKTARHIVAKLSAFLDLAAILLTSAGVLASHGKYHLLCAAGIFWGLSTACDSNTDALFADSVPTGQRSTQFTQLQALSLACLGAGPLIAAAIFHSQGTASTSQCTGRSQPLPHHFNHHWYPLETSCHTRAGLHRGQAGRLQPCHSIPCSTAYRPLMHDRLQTADPAHLRFLSGWMTTSSHCVSASRRAPPELSIPQCCAGHTMHVLHSPCLVSGLHDPGRNIVT